MNIAEQHPARCEAPPQTPLAVRVYPEFANSLRTHFENGAETGSPAESGGLLFGTTEQDVVTLRAFRPFAIWRRHQDNSATQEQIDKPVRELSDSFSADQDLRNSELVGWCYLRQAGVMGLLERDVQFHNRHFPRTTDLLVILNAGSEQGILIELFAPTSHLPLSAQEFRWGSFHLSLDSPLTRLMDVNLEKRHKRDDSPTSQITVSASPAVTVNTLALLPEASAFRKSGLLWLISGALLVLALAMISAWAHTRARDSRPIGRSAQISTLRMHVENSRDGILLSWNRDATAMRSAKQGILHIQDGSEQRAIYLDPSDLANSSIVYRPDSNDASFRLELLGEHGSTESNRVRAHDSLKATPAQSPDVLTDYVPARALKEVLPDENLFASRNNREETRVDVQVRIDENGLVQEAHVKNGGQSGLLRNAALEAAKHWIFEPAKRNGKNIPSDHTIEFQFHR
jgi:TonB family protein